MACPWKGIKSIGRRQLQHSLLQKLGWGAYFPAVYGRLRWLQGLPAARSQTRSSPNYQSDLIGL